MEERVNLENYLTNEDKPYGESNYGWYAQEQLEALSFYLKDVNIIYKYMEDDYQGDCFAIFVLEDNKKIILWRDSFGSCSGCDALEGENGYDYIKNTLQEGNTKQFNNLRELIKYVNESEDYYWETFKKLCLSDIINLIGD